MSHQQHILTVNCVHTVHYNIVQYISYLLYINSLMYKGYVQVTYSSACTTFLCAS